MDAPFALRASYSGYERWKLHRTSILHLDQEMANIFEGEDASQYASSSEHWQEL